MVISTINRDCLPALVSAKLRGERRLSVSSQIFPLSALILETIGRRKRFRIEAPNGRFCRYAINHCRRPYRCAGGSLFRRSGRGDGDYGSAPIWRVRKGDRGTLRPRIAVLITAHNEGVGLTPLLEDLKQQVQPNDRILVVADNCTDDTASIASAHGVQVIERRGMTKRDKGFALDFGIRHLALDPPEILIMLDADCRLADNATTSWRRHAPPLVDRCRRCTACWRHPARANNLQVAEFTWRVKNWLRPLGL